MGDKELAIRGDKELAIYEQETRFAVAVKQRELLENYIRERLKPDKHFYTVAEGQKPSLTKEGAELICLPHALKAHYNILSGPESPPLDDAPYQITVKCEFETNGKFAGEGIGSASSMVTKKAGERVQRQKDPGLRHNATIKMACKSAYIAGTLNSTAASEFFTQDLEDMEAPETPKTDTVNTKEHYCEEHKVNFFKRGKMKNFAHPIGETGKWCNEEKPKAANTPDQEEPPEELFPEETPAKAPIAPGKIDGWGEVGQYVAKAGVSQDAVKAEASKLLMGAKIPYLLHIGSAWEKMPDEWKASPESKGTPFAFAVAIVDRLKAGK